MRYRGFFTHGMGGIRWHSLDGVDPACSLHAHLDEPHDGEQCVKEVPSARDVLWCPLGSALHEHLEQEHDGQGEVCVHQRLLRGDGAGKAKCESSKRPWVCIAVLVRPAVVVTLSTQQPSGQEARLPRERGQTEKNCCVQYTSRGTGHQDQGGPLTCVLRDMPSYSTASSRALARAQARMK